MTTKESRRELERIKKAVDKEAQEAAILKHKLNTLLASIAINSREIALLPKEMSRVLSKLVQKTRYETIPTELGPDIFPDIEFQVSDVYGFGRDPFRYRVWFQRPGRSGEVFLYFSRITQE